MKRDKPAPYTDSKSTTNDQDTDIYSISDQSEGIRTPNESVTSSPKSHETDELLPPPAYIQTSESSFYEQDHKSEYSLNSHDPLHVENTPLKQSTVRTGNACFILNHLPAAWTTQTRTGGAVRLSALAAGVLLKSGRLTENDLELYKPSSNEDQGPTDPISGALISAHTIVGGVLRGVADFPIILTSSIKTSSSPAQFGKQFAPLNPDGPKGVSRIVGTALMAPMEVTMGVARGFENLTGVWGDEGRKAERGEVVGVGSGLLAAGKGLGYGLFDGITGLATQPFKGVQEGKKDGGGVWGGVWGGVKGFGKGIGGVVCKPAAGAVGLPAYAFKGVYEEVSRKHAKSGLLQDGEKGYEQMAEADREVVLLRWEYIQ